MRYLILGVTEARDETGAPLPIGGARLRALLAALALRAGGPTASVTALVDEVWGDAPPLDAPAALQALVSRLRRTLGGRDTVHADPAGGYRLAADRDDVDLHRFTRLAARGARELAADPAAAARTLRTALALWRGPALADLPEPGRTGHAAAPEARRAAALRDRIQADLRSGATAPAALLPELEALIHHHPYDEPLRAQHLRALRAAGRTADALAAYEHTRRTLADSLGTDPGPELRTLHAELLNPPPPPPRTTTTDSPQPGTWDTAVDRQPARGAWGTGPDGLPGEGAWGGDPGRQSPPPARVAPATRSPQPGARDTAPDRRPASEAGGGNLRPRLTSFVGREPELDALRGDLGRLRLVTLTGPGGSGKTRLAEHAAAAHPEAGWIVELARLDDPAAVPGAVLSALGLRENTLVARESTGAGAGAGAAGASAPVEPATRLVEHCAHRRLLLVLDNCEHVIGAAAELAELLLTHCPGVRILATSREPLGVPGESVRPVEPLPPDPAHRLFADRGASVRPGFSPAEDPAAVAEICARLDGLPLAIELAAARLRLLTPRQIADRLDDRFRLLTSGSRTVLPRQQTLRAVVDWSWDLLEAPERTVLARLSVFAGGCDLAAAEAVCADDTALDVADILGSLVDKSLVLAEPAPHPDGADAMRYRMLETIHEYAAERAAADPADRAATARRHTAHFLALAERAEPLLRSAAQLPWIRCIETELDNLRAALHHATDTDTHTAERLAFALGWFWWLRNYRTEGARWTTRILTATGPADPPEGSPAYWRTMRLRVLNTFLLAESNPPETFRTPEYQALAARIEAAFRPGSPETTRFPGMLWPATVFLAGDARTFHANLDHAVANCRRHAGDWELGVTLMLRTQVAIDLSGGLSSVDADLAELREIALRVGDRWTRAQVASAGGELALTRGRYDWARAEYEECLRLAREVGAHIEAPFAIARIAETAYCTGELDVAERLIAESDAEAERYGVVDVRSFNRMLSALVAIQRGDFDGARAAYDDACRGAAEILVPPQMTAALAGLGAVLAAHAHGARAGLALIVPAFAAAVEAHCAERVLAGLAETAARLLADTDRPAEAVRVLAAATAWRAGHPRSAPEQAAVDGLPARTRALLGPADHTREESAGAALTPTDIASALTTG